jgi:hypothetical protein
MSADVLSNVGRRLLGIYFVVQGALAAAAAIGAFGIIVPDGSSRVGLVAAALAQGAIAAMAGAWLLRTALPMSQTELPTLAAAAGRHSALQLLGVFFFVSGLVTLARLLAGLDIIQAWQFQLSDLASGAVEAAVGAILVLRARDTARVLDRYAAGA